MTLKECLKIQTLFFCAFFKTQYPNHDLNYPFVKTHPFNYPPYF